MGALDETRGEAYVRIANYMTGPSNCIASSSYYSVCCLNECEGLMNELESKASGQRWATSFLMVLEPTMLVESFRFSFKPINKKGVPTQKQTSPRKRCGHLMFNGVGAGRGEDI